MINSRNELPTNSRVVINTEIWAGSIGILEDKIPNTQFYNVRLVMQDKLRLALKRSEFELEK